VCVVGVGVAWVYVCVRPVLLSWVFKAGKPHVDLMPLASALPRVCLRPRSFQKALKDAFEMFVNKDTPGAFDSRQAAGVRDHLDHDPAIQLCAHLCMLHAPPPRAVLSCGGERWLDADRCSIRRVRPHPALRLCISPSLHLCIFASVHLCPSPTCRLQVQQCGDGGDVRGPPAQAGRGEAVG